MCESVCVCVCVRERESVCVCVCHVHAHTGVHAPTVTLGMVLPVAAHLSFRSDPCLKMGRKKSEKSLGVSAMHKTDREMEKTVRAMALALSESNHLHVQR